MELEMYNLTSSQLEDIVDTAKVAVAKALVQNGLLKEDDADEWCGGHTVIIRNKSFFRTISEKWIKAKDVSGEIQFIVVEKI